MFHSPLCSFFLSCFGVTMLKYRFKETKENGVSYSTQFVFSTITFKHCFVYLNCTKEHGENVKRSLMRGSVFRFEMISSSPVCFETTYLLQKQSPCTKNSPGSIDIHPIDAAELLGVVATPRAAADDDGHPKCLFTPKGEIVLRYEAQRSEEFGGVQFVLKALQLCILVDCFNCEAVTSLAFLLLSPVSSSLQRKNMRY